MASLTVPCTSAPHIAQAPIQPAHDVPATKPPLISDPATDADWFVNEIWQADMINKGGWLLEGVELPDMPALAKTSMERVNFVLSRLIKLPVLDLRRELPCKQFFLKLDLDKGRIFLVGGIVLWILGSEGLYKAGTSLLKDKFLRCYKISSLSSFDQRKGDVDSRYVENPIAGNVSDPEQTAESLLKSLAKDFQPCGHDIACICNELRKKGGPFRKFHPFFDLDRGTVDHQAFLMNHHNGDDFELDLMLASFLKEEALLSMQDLYLDITDYIQGSTNVLQVSGKSFKGWQAIIALLGRLIQFQSMTPQAWARAESRKVLSYRSLTPFPEEVYRKIKVRSLGSILQNIATGHLNHNPIAACMFLIDSASDLMRHGIHPVDVDQICQSVKIEGKLPSDLECIRQARLVLPMEVILAVLQLSRLKNMQICLTGNQSSIRWGQAGSECVIQLDIEKAIETLIIFEMSLKASQSHKKYQALLDLLYHLSVCEKPDKEIPLVLQIVEGKFHAHLNYACDVYFKNRESDVKLSFELLRRLDPNHLKKAVQLFGIHLLHAKKIEDVHLEYYEKISEILFSGRQCQDIEAVNHVLSFAQTITRGNLKFQKCVLKVIENAVCHHIDNNKPKFAAWILKQSSEAGLLSHHAHLWLQCIEGIFKQKTGFHDAFKLWVYADRNGIWTMNAWPEEHIGFLLDFIKALYQQDSSECYQAANGLFKWLPAVKYEGDYANQVHTLKSMRDHKKAEYEASQRHLSGMFEFLGQQSQANDGENHGKIRDCFVELLKIIGRSDISEWQAHVNKVYQLIPKIQPVFSENQMPFYDSLLGLVESSFECDFKSTVVLDLFEQVIREMPAHPKVRKLVIRGIKEERLEIGSPQFLSTLIKAQSILFNELYKEGHWSDILLLVEYFGQRLRKLCGDTALYYDVFLRTLVKYLEENKTVDVYSPKMRQSLATLHANKSSKIEKLTQAQCTLLIRLVDALQSHRMVEESITWVQYYLGGINWQLEGLPPDAAENLLRWTNVIARQNRHESSFQFLEFLLKQVPAMQSRTVDLIMDLPDNFLDIQPLAVAKVTQERIKEHSPIADSFHIRAKIAKLMDILTQQPLRSDYCSSAIDFMELSIEDSLETQLKVMQLMDGMPPLLKLRSWKLFRGCFREYLVAEDPKTPQEPTMVKCLKASHKILKGISTVKYADALPAIESDLDYYCNPDTPLENWLSDPKKKKKMLEDLDSLLTARFAFLVPGPANSEYLKKVLSIRIRLLSEEGLKQEVLKAFHDFDGILVEHLVIQPDMDLFMEGVRIFNAYAKKTTANTPRFVDLFCKILEFWETDKLTNLDKVDCQNLMHEVGIIFWNRPHTKQDELRVGQTIYNNTKDIKNKSPEEVAINRNLKVTLGIATAEEIKEERESFYAPKFPKANSTKIGPVVFHKDFLNRIYLRAAQVAIVGLILYFLYRQTVNSDFLKRFKGGH